MNPIPIHLEAGWPLVAVGFFLAALAVTFGVRVLQKRVEGERKVRMGSIAIILSSFLLLLSVAHTIRLSMIGLLTTIPIALVCIGISTWIERHGEMKRRLRVWLIVLASLGLVFLGILLLGVLVWGYVSLDAGHFQPRELSGLYIFGSVGLVMVGIAMIHLHLETGKGLRKCQVVCLLGLILLVVTVVLVDLVYLMPTPRSWVPPIRGGMLWLGPGSDWTASPDTSFEIELLIKPEKGEAKGFSILLECGRIKLMGASADPRSREGRYQWLYRSLARNEEDRIQVELYTPEDADQDQEIKMYYAYTNEDPILLDNRTITTNPE